jgi:hypothetical protein
LHPCRSGVTRIRVEGVPAHMRDGIIIQEQACPRCAIRRTARLAYGTSFCFNCRLQWPAHQTPCARAVEVEPPRYVFAADELLRLTAYRAAVREGFYSDWRDSSPAGFGPHELEVAHE